MRAGSRCPITRPDLEPPAPAREDERALAGVAAERIRRAHLSLSTPSANDPEPEVCARSIVDSHDHVVDPMSRLAMNERSILSSSTGSRRR